MKIKIAIESYLKYWKSRYENWMFPSKLKSRPLVIPSGLVHSIASFSASFPSLASRYPNREFGDVVKSARSAAVIFNSGLILENTWGDEIDSHDLVIRINFITTKGYEKHAGARTDIRILGRNWLFREKNEWLIHTYNAAEYASRDEEIFTNSPRLASERPLYVFDNKQWQPVYDYFGASVSNGLRAVILGLSLADKVKIYGADPASRTWYKGKKLTHFPSEKDLETVQQHMLPYSLLHQEYDRYFGGTAMKNGVVSTIHHTINKEYMFYDAHPGVSIASPQ